MIVELRPRATPRKCPYCFDTLEGWLVACACGATFHRGCAANLQLCSTLGCKKDLGLPPVHPRRLESRALDVGLVAVVLLGFVFACLSCAGLAPINIIRCHCFDRGDTPLILVESHRLPPIAFPDPIRRELEPVELPSLELRLPPFELAAPPGSCELDRCGDGEEPSDPEPCSDTLATIEDWRAAWRAVVRGER